MFEENQSKINEPKSRIWHLWLPQNEEYWCETGGIQGYNQCSESAGGISK